MNTVCRANGAAVSRTGLATASASSATASSWRNSRADGLSRCHGEAADTGSANGFHRYVDPTTTSGRRGRRMCSSTIGIASASSASPAGSVKLTAARGQLSGSRTVYADMNRSARHRRVAIVYR